jgi:tRNA(fMet)-specific endonuclease VapC
MNNYLLDTNACIIYLNNRDSPIKKQMQRYMPEQIYLCSVVKSELFFGAMKSQRIESNLKRLDKLFSLLPSVPFSDKSAILFGEIRAYLQKRGTPIGPYDTQIAAIALEHDFILVTHNTKEFARVEGLKIEDWEDL